MSFSSNTSNGITGPEYYASGSFYGLKFFNEIKDNLDFDRKLPCVPDIFTSDENTKILLDYTSCIEESSSNYIQDIIRGISLGSGFTLENAKYIDKITGVESDLSGYYTYSATFDKAIYATCSDIPYAEDLDKKYWSDGFIEDFTAIFSVKNENTTEQNIIKNVFGTDVSPSFTNLGLKSGDFIKILNGSNSSTTKLHEVINFYTDHNDHEIVQFGNSADLLDENRVGVNSDIRLYRSDSSAERASYYVNKTGELVLTSNTYYITGIIATINLSIVSNKFAIFSNAAPNLVLATNASYIFNTTGLNVNEHSFRISSTPDGKWNGGTQHPEIEVYDNFVLFNPKSTGTFYYYCEKHPNMGAIIKVENQSVNELLQQIPSYVDRSLANATINSLSSTSSAFYS